MYAEQPNFTGKIANGAFSVTSNVWSSITFSPDISLAAGVGAFFGPSPSGSWVFTSATAAMSEMTIAFCIPFGEYAHQCYALTKLLDVAGVPSWNFIPAFSLIVYTFESVVLIDSAAAFCDL